MKTYFLETTIYESRDKKFIIRREWGKIPELHNPLGGKWVLREVSTNKFIDADMYINDLLERNNGDVSV